MPKPTLLIISATIRRDLHRPFTRFTRFRVIHAYMNAAYGDMDRVDFGPDARPYRSARELRALLYEIKPDLIQAPEPAASRAMLRMGYEVWRYARQTTTPYFFPMFENRPLRRKFGVAAGAVMEQILKRFATQARWVFYLNEGAHTTLTKVGVPASKLIRANWGNWGIDRAEFVPATNPADARTDHPAVLFVGRLSKAKGVDTLIEAFSRAHAELPNAELWLVGPTDLDADSNALREKTVHLPSVQFLGPKKQRELPALFQQAWVTVLLSRTTKQWAEQVGMVNLQSLACGTPVVSTNSGSIPEYLESNQSYESGVMTDEEIHTSYLIPHTSIHDTHHGALLVSENDPKAAAEAILAILQDPKRRESMGKAGVDWITSSFDVATTVPTLEQFLFDQLSSP